MLFDVQSALAEILASPPATPATFATQPPKSPPVSQVSRVSQSQAVETRSAAPPVEPSAPMPSRQDAEAFPYGTGQGERPRTWTGRVVSLDEWRRLSDWERHGSTGQHFNGLSGRWEHGDAQ